MPPYFSMKERYSGILMVPVKINWNAVWDLGTGLKYNRRNSFHKPADEIMFLVFLTDNAIIQEQKCGNGAVYEKSSRKSR